ncbi:MAG TPA: trypsin-like peptidase domain-containing protein [Pirellulales bacterium]|nr:trypsin-like peptidase domain-containing protein [Pirellulales bacterium]
MAVIVVVMRLSSAPGGDSQNVDSQNNVAASNANLSVSSDGSSVTAPGSPAPGAVATNPAGAPSSVAGAATTATPPVAPPAAAPVAAQPVSSVPPGSPLVGNPNAPSAASPEAPVFAYRFNPGEEYAYALTVKASLAGKDDKTTGQCTLNLSREAAPPEFAAHDKKGQGSGSAFVVSSDGYLVTCAHCVEGSTKIEAVLGGQTYPTQVVAFDKPHDLAVIRIFGTSLPTVPLANSDTVEQAQEVRAVGYPLSDVLGESVKITRGTIAGIVNTSGRKLFQVDASINPGNSGGPVVNEMGQVIGVASAKLAGDDVDGVGFVVPANEVLNLLRSKGISVASTGASARLDGPALARQVTPAVAMLKITIGPGGYGAAGRLLVDYSGHVSSIGAPHVVGRTQLPGMPKVESERGKLLLSDRGELLDVKGNVQLPYLLGPLGAAFVEPLPDGAERTWQWQRASSLTQIIGEQNDGPLSLRFRHRGRNPFASQTKIVVTPAIEMSSYELTGATGNVVTIVKRYGFQTLPQSVTPPVAKMTGEGTITFNREKGYAEKMTFTATLVRSSNNVSVTVPLTMDWRRLSQAELETARAQAKANQEAAKQAAAERAARESAPRTPGEIDEMLADLSNADFSKRLAILTSLEKMKPIDERRAAVTKAVEPIMRDSNPAVRDRAIHVMGHWGTKDTVKVLVKMLDQLDFGIRHTVIDALAMIDDAMAAKAIANLVPEQNVRMFASAALKKMGRVAEAPTIALLKHSDKQVRHEACNILGEVAGPKGIAALKRLLQDEKDSLPRSAAQQALRKLDKKS